MLMTAATELGTGTWIVALLSGAGVSGILILVFINGIMAFSALFAGIGLLLLSQSSGYSAIASAFVFAIGICFFWPTMLGFVSEYLPKTGALGLSLMGGAGMFSTALIIPVMGRWFDAAKSKAVAEGVDAIKAEAVAGSDTFMKVAIMPAILFIVFIAIYVVRKNRVSAKSPSFSNSIVQ
jgi:MFS family permease